MTGTLEAGEVVFNGTTTLFRAVSNEEFEQALAEQAFKSAPGKMEGKWFATTYEDAQRWGELMGSPRILSVEMPSPIVKFLMRVERLDGVGPAVWAEIDQLFQISIQGLK